MALGPNDQPKNSIEKFESMLKTDNVYFFDAEDFEQIIHHYLDDGKIGLGKKAIKLALEQHPVSIELRLLKVEVLVFEDNFKDAEILLDQLQDIDPNNEEIYIQRANILSKKDNHLEAVNMLMEALHIADDCYDIHSLMGMEYLFMDNYEQAKKSFIKCLEYDESDYSALYNVIYCFEFLEDFEGAIVYLNDYLERNPYCEVAWHQLGKMYQQKEMMNEALSAFDFAIIADDRFIGAYFEKAKVLEYLGRYNEAIENYEFTLKIDDPTSHAYLRIGKCHEKLGNDELAKYYYYNTVHEDPLLDKGWLAITEFYFKKKNYKKALHYVNKATNIDSENPLYWKKSAKIYQKLQNYPEADFAFRQTVNLGNYELDTWVDWAKVLLKLNDYHTATQILLQGLDFYTNEAELHFLLAGAYLKVSDYAQAKEQIKSAVNLKSKKPAFFLKLFPEFKKVTWVRQVLNASKKAST